jgi:dihydrofolate synthase/folylpolyglutamate synthase
LGFATGHYTSPHIIEFNERIWMNGTNVSSAVLNKTHIKLLSLLREQEAASLSYFEYTTLLALFVYQECDYVVLEAGLGGEHDATAVFENILTLVTPISFDHEAFLGSDIESIARTKINAVKRKAILAKQSHEEVYTVAQSIAKDKNVYIEKYNTLLDNQDYKKLDKIAKNNHLPLYLKENLMLSIAALKILGIKYEAENFNNARLFGRLSQLDSNILIDVGHNVLAAKAIYKTLKENKYILVYNSYKDKNYNEILNILRPIILHVEVINVNDERIEKREKLLQTLASLNIKHRNFTKIETQNNYLVFGSFSVVEAFLKEYRE